MSRSTPASSSGRSGDGGDERRVDADRAQVGEQAEPAAQREQRLLRADRRRRVVPRRAADGAEQDRVGRAAGGDVLVADRRRRTRRSRRRRRRCSVQSIAKPNRVAGRVEDAPGGGDDLRPDAVARDRRRSGTRQVARSAPSRSRQAARAWRGETKATVDAVDLGAVELVDRHEVGLERRLDDVRRQARGRSRRARPGPRPTSAGSGRGPGPGRPRRPTTALISYSVRTGASRGPAGARRRPRGRAR